MPSFFLFFVFVLSSAFAAGEKPEKPLPADGLTLVTTMQWFYGPTWGSTLVLCGNLAPKEPCVRLADVHARQLELLEALRRNALHPAVSEVHVLVGEAPPVERLLARLGWYQERGKSVVRLVGVSVRPSFRTYLEYISTSLRGRTIVLTNQDVFLAGGWGKLATAGLPGG